MRRVLTALVITLTLALVPVSGARLPVRASSIAAKTSCKTVVKTVNGHRKKVRVCSHVSTPTATPTISLPPRGRCSADVCPVPQAALRP